MHINDLKLSPSAYKIDGIDNFWIELRLDRDRVPFWVVANMGFVLSKSEKDFIWEPIPSSRGDEFCKDTWFISPDDALNAFKDWIVRNHEIINISDQGRRGKLLVLRQSKRERDYHTKRANNDIIVG